MAVNSFNLIEAVKGYMGGDVIGRMSSMLGESKDKTRAGINAAVPAMLSEFDNMASTPDGARRLAAAVDDADDSILDNIGGLLSRGGGTGILTSLLGGSVLSSMAGRIGGSSGLGGKSVMSMLGFVGPVLLGVLKRQKQSRGLDATGLASMLSSQRSYFGARQEPTYAEPLREATHTYESERPRVRTGAAEVHRVEAREPRGSALRWILPLALLALLGGLIWNYATRQRGETVYAGREDANITQQVTQVRDDLTSVHRSALGTLRSVTDESTADAAAPKIRDMNSRLDRIYDSFSALPTESRKSVSSLMPSMHNQLAPEINRVMAIPGAAARVGPALSDMHEKFERFAD